METNRLTSSDLVEVAFDPVSKRDVLEYDAETGTYRASFDDDTESPSLAVISTVAVVLETPATELPPLHGACDTDALERLVGETGNGHPDSGIHVSFTFAGYPVTVSSTGTVVVHAARTDEAPSADERTTDRETGPARD